MSATVLLLALMIGEVLVIGALLAYLGGHEMRRRRWIRLRFAGQDQSREAVHQSGDQVGTGYEQLVQGTGPQVGFINLTRHRLAALRSDMPRGMVLIGALLLAGLVLVAVRAFRFGPIAALSLAIVGAVGLLVVSLSRQQRRRRAEIEDHLPDAFDIVIRSLRIGTPVGAALSTVGRDMPGVLGREFTLAADQIRFGKEIGPALRELAQRCDSAPLRFFSAAVVIQAETGGNLVMVLERLAVLARARIQLRRKIVAMTSEAKWSGWFLSIFPVAAALGIALINPGYFSNLFGKPFFYPLMAVVGLFLIANVLFMRRMIRFE